MNLQCLPQAKSQTRICLPWLKGLVPREHVLCVRWYVAYPLSLRHLEEMMAERGVMVESISLYVFTGYRTLEPRQADASL